MTQERGEYDVRITLSRVSYFILTLCTLVFINIILCDMTQWDNVINILTGVMYGILWVKCAQNEWLWQLHTAFLKQLPPKPVEPQQLSPERKLRKEITRLELELSVAKREISKIRDKAVTNAS